MSDSVQPHRWQLTRLPHPWDSPGKNTGVGCHFLLQSMKVKNESEVAQLCPTRSDPMDCSLPGSSIHGIFQARVLEGHGKKNSSEVHVLQSATHPYFREFRRKHQTRPMESWRLRTWKSERKQKANKQKMSFQEPLEHNVIRPASAQSPQAAVRINPKPNALSTRVSH